MTLKIGAFCGSHVFTIVVIVFGLWCLSQGWCLDVDGGGVDRFVLVDRVGEALVTDLDFSPDGGLVAASGQGLGVYDSRTGERIVYQSDPWINRVAWSPDGGLIAVSHSGGPDGSGDSSGSVELLESRLLTLDRVSKLVEPYPSTSISWSPGGGLLATTGYSRVPGNRSISIWNVSTGEIQRCLEWGTERAARIVRWSPDGSSIASILEPLDGKGTLWVWDIATLIIESDRDFESPVSDVEWSPDGSLLAMCFDDDQDILILDPLTMLEITQIRSKQDMSTAGDVSPSAGLPPYDIAWSRNGSLLAGAFPGGVVEIWNASSGVTVSRSRVPGGRGLCFSPTEDELVVGGGTGIDVWNYVTDHHVQSPASGPFATAAWSRTGDTVFCSTENDGVVAVTGLWEDSEPPRLETIIPPGGKDLRAVLLSSDERYLAAFWQYPRRVEVWDLLPDPPSPSASYTSRAFSAAFSPMSDKLTWSDLGQLMIMDIASNKTITLNPRSRILVLDWPSTETILSGNERDDGSGEVVVWDAQNGTVLKRVPNERGAVWAIASSPMCSPEDRTVAVLCGPYSLWYYYGGLRVYNSSWDIIHDGSVKGASTFSWPSLSWSPEGEALTWAHYTGRYPPEGESLYTTLLFSTNTWNLTQTLDGTGASWLDEERLLTISRSRTGHGSLLLWQSVPETPLILLGITMILLTIDRFAPHSRSRHAS